MCKAIKEISCELVDRKENRKGARKGVRKDDWKGKMEWRP